MKAGDQVIYPSDPLLYGIMLLVEVRRVSVVGAAGKRSRIYRYSCLVNPDTWHRRTEHFSRAELDFAPARTELLPEDEAA